MAIAMLRSERNRPERQQALERVREWTRARFELSDEAITVAEVACTLPGCPPLETFKPVTEVLEDDLPPRWMKNAIAVPDDFECTCC
jgi:hypothetical protein